MWWCSPGFWYCFRSKRLSTNTAYAVAFHRIHLCWRYVPVQWQPMHWCRLPVRRRRRLFRQVRRSRLSRRGWSGWVSLSPPAILNVRMPRHGLVTTWRYLTLLSLFLSLVCLDIIFCLFSNNPNEGLDGPSASFWKKNFWIRRNGFDEMILYALVSGYIQSCHVLY